MISTQRRSSQLALDALGNPIRRQILAILAEGERSVGEVASEFSVSRPAVSKHLKLLQQAELVAFTTTGNRNVFRLNRAGFDNARAWLQSFWDEALVRFAELAEQSVNQESKTR